MWINILKIVIGFLWIIATVREYLNYYAQIGRHSISFDAIIILCIFIGIIVVYCGIKKKTILSTVRKKSILFSIAIITSAILIDYSYSYLTKKNVIRQKNQKEEVFIDHNFSIKFPSPPKISKIEPNTKGGLIGGYHFISEKDTGSFMVVYFDYIESVINKMQDREFIDSMLLSVSSELKFKPNNVKNTEVQGFMACRFDMNRGNKKTGEGLVILFHNRLWFVVLVQNRPDLDEQIYDDYIESFKILNTDINQNRT